VVFLLYREGRPLSTKRLNMDKNKETVNTSQSAVTDTTTKGDEVVVDDAEARIAQLEADKAKLIEEGANWKLAALKNKGKVPKDDSDEDDEETEAERVRRLVQEEISKSKIAQIDAEKDKVLKQALKENKELKLAHLNKTTATPNATVGTHTETVTVQDTLVTPEQTAAFKARGWTDKDIERYKKNLQRVGGGGR